MKKLFSLLLACMMLFLTACNETPPNGTTPGNSQASGTPNDSELKDTIIVDEHDEFIDIPSRILFEQSGYVFYYSKADGKAYVYCFDPLCSHEGGCLARPSDGESIIQFTFENTFFINNRFYSLTTYGQIYSFNFDGSDIKIEYGEEYYTQSGYSPDGSFVQGNINYYLWSPNFVAYDKYIYIPIYADENGNPRILRFNTETKEMEDLTEKTGNCILPDFFYNGEVYGSVFPRGDYYKANPDLSEIERIDEIPFYGNSKFYGSIIYSTAYDNPDDYDNRKHIGIQAYDVKTGETTLISNEALGWSADYNYSPFAIDEDYIYFEQKTEKSTVIGTYTDLKGNVQKKSTYNTGKFYRVKHDGTECVCIYDNQNFVPASMTAVIYGDKMLLEGTEYTVENGVIVNSFGGIQVGTMGENGKIDKFEPIELVY